MLIFVFHVVLYACIQVRFCAWMNVWMTRSTKGGELPTQDSSDCMRRGSFCFSLGDWLWICGSASVVGQNWTVHSQNWTHTVALIWTQSWTLHHTPPSTLHFTVQFDISGLKHIQYTPPWYCTFGFIYWQGIEVYCLLFIWFESNCEFI